jgi:aspartyl-tRNA(Asn)/glutamyl-tRNA(Gln) amidotransferase subunit C
VAITEIELQQLAKLAKLNLSADDIPNYLESINKLLGILGELEAVDVSELDDESQDFLQQAGMLLRDDIVTYQSDIENIQKQAPEVIKNFYIVPKVIDDSQEDSDV